MPGCLRSRLHHVSASQVTEGLSGCGVEELEPEVADPGPGAPQADGERQRRHALQNVPVTTTDGARYRRGGVASVGGGGSGWQDHDMKAFTVHGCVVDGMMRTRGSVVL